MSPMLRLRQICLVAHDRDSVVSDLRHVFHLGEGHEDPGVGAFGLHNCVLPVGDQFLEVVAPVQEGTTAGRYLQRRNGDGGYMLIFQTDDHARYRARVGELGMRVVTDVTYSGYTCMQLHPADNGGTFLEIDHNDPADEWVPAGRDWKSHVDTTLVTGFTQADVSCTDPERTSGVWGSVTELPVTIGRNCGMHKVRPDGFCVRFVPAGARGEGLDAVDVSVRDRAEILRRASDRGLPHDDESVTVCGVRFVLKD